jgi:hypothetical protein
LKPETRDRLLTGIDSATAKLTQFSTIESVAHWLWEFSGRVHRKMENVRTREQIIALLDAEPEPSASTVWALGQIAHFAPYLANRVVKKIAKDSVKDLRENPPGPKPVVEDWQKPLICAFIRDLYGNNKVSVQDAQRRAAAKWGIGLRSVERIWAERGTFAEPKMSIDEAETVALEWWQSSS